MASLAGPQRFHLPTALAACLLPLLLVLTGLWVFTTQAGTQVTHQAEQKLALAQARMAAQLVDAAGQANASDIDVQAALTQAFANAYREGDQFRAILRSGKSIRFSTFTDDKTATGFPRSLLLQEKPLYDLLLTLPPTGAVTRQDVGETRAAHPIGGANGVIGYVEIARIQNAASLPAGMRVRDIVVLILIGLGGVALARARPAWLGLIAVMTTGLAAYVGWILANNQLAIVFIEALAAANQHGEVLGQAGAKVAQAAGWNLVSAAAAPVFTDQMGEAHLDALAKSIWATAFLAATLAAFIGFGGAASAGRAYKDNPTAYHYVGPAVIGMLALAFFPFFYGVTLSFTDTTLLNQGQSFAQRWIGLSNYVSILNDFRFGGEGTAFNYQNFYWTLGVTIVWTITNVGLGVSIGLGLAILLNTKGLRGVAIYRTLLILPWAIPNYITALTWKGMFHPQFGAINQIISAFGGTPVQWFDSFGPSFITGLATNAWLSFPFMMVVALGALQSVDEDMYEAARIDGASSWQQFWHITLPSLRPALLPAIIVSVVWTFNMFNVIYLVSAGQPSGSTEILVTRAYKIAFEEYRYGYAAAYSVVIFLILLMYGVFQIKATAATEANNS
ncbi:MAG: hypothetical protein RL186_290 [Pseudomonadota bacterium]